jgi:hypothetical protein
MGSIRLKFIIALAILHALVARAEYTWGCNPGYFLFNGLCYPEQYYVNINGFLYLRAQPPSPYQSMNSASNNQSSWPSHFMPLDSSRPDRYPNIRRNSLGAIFELGPNGAPEALQIRDGKIEGNHASELEQHYRDFRSEHPKDWSTFVALQSSVARDYLMNLDAREAGRSLPSNNDNATHSVTKREHTGETSGPRPSSNDVQISKPSESVCEAEIQSGNGEPRFKKIFATRGPKRLIIELPERLSAALQLANNFINWDRLARTVLGKKNGELSESNISQLAEILEAASEPKASLDEIRSLAGQLTGKGWLGMERYLYSIPDKWTTEHETFPKIFPPQLVGNGKKPPRAINSLRQIGEGLTEKLKDSCKNPLTITDLERIKKIRSTVIHPKELETSKFNIVKNSQDQNNLWRPSDPDCLVLIDATHRGKQSNGMEENGALDDAELVFKEMGYSHVYRYSDTKEIGPLVDSFYRQSGRPVCLTLGGHGMGGHIGAGSGPATGMTAESTYLSGTGGDEEVIKALRGKVREVFLYACGAGRGAESLDYHVMRTLARFLPSNPKSPVPIHAYSNSPVAIRASGDGYYRPYVPAHLATWPGNPDGETNLVTVTLRSDQDSADGI